MLKSHPARWHGAARFLPIACVGLFVGCAAPSRACSSFDVQVTGTDKPTREIARIYADTFNFYLFDLFKKVRGKQCLITVELEPLGDGGGMKKTFSFERNGERKTFPGVLSSRPQYGADYDLSLVLRALAAEGHVGRRDSVTASLPLSEVKATVCSSLPENIAPVTFPRRPPVVLLESREHGLLDGSCDQCSYARSLGVDEIEFESKVSTYDRYQAVLGARGTERARRADSGRFKVPVQGPGFYHIDLSSSYLDKAVRAYAISKPTADVSANINERSFAYGGYAITTITVEMKPMGRPGSFPIVLYSNAEFRDQSNGLAAGTCKDGPYDIVSIYKDIARFWTR